jgi:hypothetical protein
MEEDGAEADEDRESASARLGRWLNAATDVLGAFGDDSAGKAIERAVGPEVRVAVQTAAAAATAARDTLAERTEVVTGEPLGSGPGEVDRGARPER